MTISAKEPKRETSLQEEVRDALLDILRDKSAPQTARASAGRTLFEMHRDDSGRRAGDQRRVDEMSAEDIDAEIARLTGKSTGEAQQ